MGRYYSQNDEEQYVLDYFGNYVGRFLDIGANDGKTLSNTYAVALKGWNGVYVEPDSRAREKLKTNIQSLPGAFEVMSFALGDKNDTVTFFQGGDSHLGGNDVGLLSTAKRMELNRWGSKEKFENTTCEMRTWLASGLDKLGPFDLISIDAEGYDWAILKQIELKSLRCKMLVVEYNNDQRLKEEIVWHLRYSGLQLRARNFENLIFADMNNKPA